MCRFPSAHRSGVSSDLEDHEGELRQLLGLSDASDREPAPDRPPTPQPVAIAAAFDEALLSKRNHGRRVFRFSETRLRGHAPLGGILGLAAGIAGTVALDLHAAITLGTTVTGFALGFAVGGTRQLYRCATCESFLSATATLCPACGGTIAGDIAHRHERLDAEEALEAAERRAGPRPGDLGGADAPDSL